MAENYFQHLQRLLNLESEAEKQESLRTLQRGSSEGAEDSGRSLTHLVIREQDAGLGGRIVLTLGKRNQDQPFPWTRLGPGSPVILSEEKNGVPPDSARSGWRGIVSRVLKDSIQVAFPEWIEVESDHPVFRLDRSEDEISLQRERQALEKAQDIKGSRLAVLREILIGRQMPVCHEIAPLIVLDQSLNGSQREAVHFALAAGDVALIHGPPGTGKTTALVEVIRQVIKIGQTVLAVAPSNLAVDHLLEGLLRTGEKAIRLGHPARVTPDLRQHTLDELVENHPDVRLAHKWIREAHFLLNQASKYTRARPEPGSRQALRKEARGMLAEARILEDQVVERLLDAAQVVCATITGLDGYLLRERVFDTCVMDEANQSTEPAAWIPLQYANRLILAGDPFQLPPTVISGEAAASGLTISLMERLMSQPGRDISRRLDVQYRMHQDIMAFSSKEFYESDLKADPSVSAHLLRDLPGLTSNAMTSTAVDFIDTAGASYDEEKEPDGESRMNPMEAELVVHKVQSLLDSGLVCSEIAVISPYSAQVRLLRERLKLTDIEIESVDGFQGREKEAVIVSLVRSNREGEIGFLADVRRMNVALTRARRKLIVIGDSATITAHPFYQRMVAFFDSIGAYHSVWEE